MRRATITALALVAVAASVQAAAEQSADGEKLICKSSMQTGTRFKTKTCHTRKQWQEIEELHKRNARELIDRPMIETRRE